MPEPAQSVKSLLQSVMKVTVVHNIMKHSYYLLFSYVPAAFSLLLGSVEAVLGDKSFQVESTTAADVLKVAKWVNQWLKESCDVSMKLNSLPNMLLPTSELHSS